jgi:O-acetyl-ADP-ribose deacetylase (regulator of RNase III)
MIDITIMMRPLGWIATHARTSCASSQPLGPARAAGLIYAEAMRTKVEIVQGDIIEETVDVIVNAANGMLMGGGGVDGAIHHAGGPEIMAECRELGGCATGDAKATTAGLLAARYVVHAVGPVWRGGERGEQELLASCYRRAVEVSDKLGCSSLAFPSISTGIYGFPIEQAAPIALSTGIAAAEASQHVRLLRYVLFSELDLSVYEEEAERLGIVTG